MNVIAKRTLVRFWAAHPQSEGPLTAWFLLASKAEWETPQDVKRQFGANVDFVGDNRAIFDIAGNKYRLIVRISCLYKAVLIKFVGTHADYDRIDPERV
ncbi:MAG: type II toxin-antitoxin system HigB family toxin [Pseudomonadota bacterium]|nr:type II toxin-antitoxin system HigB family toxin [Pseudomonadota bacterium]